MLKNFIILFTMVLLACSLFAQTTLPITSYDYAIPANNVSPITMGRGAINLSNSDDPFAAYSNPALLASNELSSFSTSFRLTSPDEINFWDAVNISNSLKDKQFKYFVVNAKQASFGYQPVAGVHISEMNSDGTSKYYDYQLDKMQVSMGGTDKKYDKLSAGLSLKYLAGRLVYLAEHRQGNVLIRDRFIDDKVKGFSTDLGFTFKQGNYTYAACAYDLLSRLWWENYDSVPLQRRMSMGMGYDTDNSHWNFGLQSKISSKPETTYHLGYGYTWNFSQSTPTAENSSRQTMDVRVGIYSKDFYGTDNINYTFGGGYYYKNIRFDFSLNAPGMKMANSEYLFALSLGI